MEDLPPGSYPILFFAMPVLVLAGVFFGTGLALLRWFGV